MASELERKFLGGQYYVWFAREINPVGDGSRPANGESSNPLILYSELDTAVKRKDVNHSKIKDLRTGLLRVIGKFVAPIDSNLAKILRREFEVHRLKCSTRNFGDWTCRGSMPRASKRTTL